MNEQNPHQPTSENVGTHIPTNPHPHISKGGSPPKMRRLNVEIPEDLFLMIDARATKYRLTNKSIVEDLLRAGVRETTNFVRMRRELLHNEPITTMIKDYQEHYSPVQTEVKDKDEEEIEALVKMLGVQTDG